MKWRKTSQIGFQHLGRFLAFGFLAELLDSQVRKATKEQFVFDLRECE